MIKITMLCEVGRMLSGEAVTRPPPMELRWLGSHFGHDADGSVQIRIVPLPSAEPNALCKGISIITQS